MKLNTYSVKLNTAKTIPAVGGGFAVSMESEVEKDEDGETPDYPGDILLGWYRSEEMAEAVKTSANKGISSTIEGIEALALRAIETKLNKLDAQVSKVA